jgi:hypothetical protein
MTGGRQMGGLLSHGECMTHDIPWPRQPQNDDRGDRTVTEHEDDSARLLLQQLERASETASRIGDRTVIYMVNRALDCCALRWGPKKADPPPEK